MPTPLRKLALDVSYIQTGVGQYSMTYSVFTVLARQAEKKAILEKIEQGKRAKKNNKNNKKRLRGPGNENSEPLLKRPKSKGDHTISSTPSPMTMNSSRPGSVLSSTSTAEPVNGGEVILDPQGPGSTDGSEGNAADLAASGPGSTPGRKPATSRLRGGAVVSKRTAAPLGGRGKMQRSGKKAGRSAAAASAGAIAGAKAATNAAFAAYGLPHHISPSPGSSAVSGSTHSSPRVSPIPMAFVATSLVTTPPTNKLSSSSSSKAPSSLTYAQK